MNKQHSPRFLKLIAEAKSRIQEVTANELKDMQEQHAKLQIIDVREESELQLGRIPQATHLGKGVIERDIEKIFPDPATPLVVYCSGGFRCALVADSLQQMGYTQVSSLAGGLNAWIEAGYSLQN